MKRTLIFALLFPPIAFVVAFWGMLQIANWALGDPTTFDAHQVVLLPLAYMLTLVPALLITAVDEALCRRNVHYRMLWTAVAGYVFIYLPLLAPMGMKFMGGAAMFAFGIIGAVPAAICCWIAGDKSSKEAVSA